MGYPVSGRNIDVFPMLQSRGDKRCFELPYRYLSMYDKHTAHTRIHIYNRNVYSGTVQRKKTSVVLVAETLRSFFKDSSM